MPANVTSRGPGNAPLPRVCEDITGEALTPPVAGRTSFPPPGSGSRADQGVVVPEAAAVHCRPMRFQAYLALPEDPLRTEYVNGWAVSRPTPSAGHQRITERLLRRLQAVAMGEVVARRRWQVRPGWVVRVPDVMVLRAAPAGALVRDAPLVVVEVQEGGEAVDLVVKAGEYLHAGAEQLWTVDLRRRVVDVHASTGTGWVRLAHLTARVPRATVEAPGLGIVELSLGEILG